MSCKERVRGLFRFLRSKSDRVRRRSPPDLGDLCRDWRQGDIFRDARTFVIDWAWEPRQIETLHGAVTISQSCDALLPTRERIQIAPLVQLEDSTDVSEAASGRRPRYVAMPRLGTDYFADLDGITTVDKRALLHCKRVPGVETDQEIREFAFSVARRFGRFAFPDEVVECLQPVTKALQSKARKEGSPLGHVLKSVHSFRVACEDWSTVPHELTLIVILEADMVPVDLEGLKAPEDVLAELTVPAGSTLADQVNRCARYLRDGEGEQSERYFVWQMMAEAWAQQCEESATSHGVTEVVGSVTVELAAVDDFPLSRYLVSESLDLDYLSDSRQPIS